VATYFLEKSKQKTRASHPKNGNLNFLNVKEKTPLNDEDMLKLKQLLSID